MEDKKELGVVLINLYHLDFNTCISVVYDKMPMIFKVILIITMISGELNYAQESFEVKTLVPKLKRWQKGVNTNDPR